jgi:hypothetical protein
VDDRTPRDHAIEDQWDAASAEMGGTLRALADDLGLPVLSLPEHELEVDLVDRWRAGRTSLRGCSHLSGSPRPVCGLVRRPGRVWCPSCFGVALGRAMSSPERCDGCWRRGRASAVVLVADGPAVLFAFLCGQCRPVDPEAA